MRILGPQRFFSLLVLVAAFTFTLACGTSRTAAANCNPVGNSNTTRTLTSVTLCPAVADAKDYSDGMVPFLATGYYTTQPSPVSPLKAFWGACYQNAPTSEVMVSASGSAQCTAGAMGTYDVFAADPTECNAITACGGGCQVSGAAKLTCP